MKTGRPARPSSSGSQPSTVGMKPLIARIPAGEGRPGPRLTAYDMTQPIEKPPTIVRSHGIPRSSSQPSRKPVSRAYVAWNVAGSGNPTRGT